MQSKKTKTCLWHYATILHVNMTVLSNLICKCQKEIITAFKSDFHQIIIAIWHQEEERREETVEKKSPRLEEEEEAKPWSQKT